MVLKSKKHAVLFLAPTIILISVFLFYPLIRSFYYSFFKWDGLSEPIFIGFKNYQRMFNDTIIKKSLINTLIMSVAAVVFEVGIALILALMVDSIKAGFKLFRTTFFFPVVISGTAIGLMFSLIYSYEYGMLNGLLGFLFKMEKQVWLTKERALGLVVLPVVWQYVGFYFVIMLTAIASVPSDIYESALLDGITGIKKAVYITIPLIRNVIFTCIALVITGVFKVFDVVYVISDGGPLNASELLSTYMYKKAFRDQAYGYGSTISILIIIVGVVLFFITNLKLIRRDENVY